MRDAHFVCARKISVMNMQDSVRRICLYVIARNGAGHEKRRLALTRGNAITLAAKCCNGIFHAARYFRKDLPETGMAGPVMILFTSRTALADVL